MLTQTLLERAPSRTFDSVAVAVAAAAAAVAVACDVFGICDGSFASFPTRPIAFLGDAGFPGCRDCAMMRRSNLQ